MSTLNVFKTVSMTMVAAAVCLSLRAQATTIYTQVNFNDPGESMWGANGPSPFHYSGSASFDLPFGLGSQTFGYSIDADAGTVMGSANGTLATTYTPVQSAPGVAHVGLQFDPTGGVLQTHIGASATLTAFNQAFGPSFGLDTQDLFTPYIGLPSPDVGVYQIADPSIDIGVASGDLDFGVVQTGFFTPLGVDGTLYYQREGSSIVQSTPFDVTTGTTLPVNLNHAGTYDFWFGDWDLLNQFSSLASLNLTANASTLVGCGNDYLESCNWSTTLANPTIYSSDPYALNFNAIAPPTPFKIEVQPVPVPHSLGLAMFGGGILLIGVLDGWRRRRAPEDEIVA